MINVIIFLPYSFSINNSSNNLSGSCNFSSFNTLRFNIKLKQPPSNEKFKYNVYLYFDYYNVIQYMNGIGGIKFAH